MGAYLTQPDTRKQTISGASARFEYAASEMQGWRMTMEDAKVIDLEVDNSTICAGVFDGHGGKDVSAFASKVFVRELVARPQYATGQFPEALSGTFLRIDELLRTSGVQQEIARGSADSTDGYNITQNSGCTAVVALVHNNDIYVANAGDSRCVMGVGKRSEALSQDHKPDLPVESNRIARAGGYVVEGRVMGNLNLSRSLGDLTYKENRDLPPKDQMISAYPDVKTVKVTPNTDFLVIACDGVWDVLTSEQCVAFIYERLDNTPLSAIVEAILDRCLASDVSSSGGLGCDNMTCVIVRFKH